MGTQDSPGCRLQRGFTAWCRKGTGRAWLLRVGPGGAHVVAARSFVLEASEIFAVRRSAAAAGSELPAAEGRAEAGCPRSPTLTRWGENLRS